MLNGEDDVMVTRPQAPHYQLFPTKV